MGRPFALFLLIILTALTAGCGGSGSATGNVGTSTVTINVGDSGRSASITIGKGSILARANRLIREFTAPSVATAAIPSEVTRIVFTISAPDMTTITRESDVAGRPTISESFTIPNGINRTILVQALDPQGRVLYQGSRIVNLGGISVTIDISMLLLNDFTPPVFSGLLTATAVSTTEIALSWNPATDNLTSQSGIYYLVFVAQTQGGENFSSPSLTTDPGATSLNITGLNPSTTYYFVVRAVDGHGNRDGNTDERSATTQTPIDVTPPTFAGLASATTSATAFGMIGLSWGPASDNVTPAAGIVYLVYMATTPGGQNFTSPNFTTDPGATTFPVTGLATGTYYFVVRARDAAGNTDANITERSAAIPDNIPPVFAGLTSAVASAVAAGRVDLSWGPATDNITPAGSIVYLIYLATTPGGETFTSPDATTQPGALSHTFFDLTPGAHFFVVRARDAAGNTDANTVELSAQGDAVPPSVNSVNLENVGTSEPVSSRITINFSEPLDATTAGDINNYLMTCSGDCPGISITSVTQPDQSTVILNLSIPYFCYETFDLTITGNLTDISGNPLPQDYLWSYATGC
jgi:hypothetical protein